MSGFRGVVNDRRSRIMLVCSGVVIIGFLAYAFMPSSNTIQRSSLPPAPAIESAQGGTEVSPQYAATLRTADQQRAQQAQAIPPGRAAAALPTPIFNPLGDRVPSLFGDRQETGREPEPPIPPLVVTPDPPPPPPQPVQQQVVVTQPPPPQPVDQALIQAMQAQMRTMLAQPIRPAEVTHFVRPGMQQGGAFGQTGGGMQEAQALAAAMREQATRSGGGMATPANPSGQVMPGQQVMATQARIPSRFSPPAAGTILYGQLVGRVNSDVPGPVIGEILQGPLAGARLLGSFQFSEQGVIIQFTSMTVPFRDADGLERTEVVPIRAFAVDAANLSTAMATSIDRRVFERVAFGFATAFLQGLGQAIASSGATTNVLPGGGVSVTTPQLNTTQQLTIAGGAAMANTARILDQTYGRRRTTIIVEAGTPFGVLFMDSQSN